MQDELFTGLFTINYLTEFFVHEVQSYFIFLVKLVLNTSSGILSQSW